MGNGKRSNFCSDTFEQRIYSLKASAASGFGEAKQPSLEGRQIYDPSFLPFNPWPGALGRPAMGFAWLSLS